MVKKLFKHEFLAYTRVMTIVYAILLVVATAGRVIQIFENDSISYDIVSIISFITYGVLIFAVLGFCFVFAVVRFYKNMFTYEGYLSFTLPVTTTQHIWVKSITALCFGCLTLIAVLISGCIITAGEVLVEIFKALGYIWQKVFELVKYHAVLITVELVILFLVVTFTSLLLYYTFISIGQLSKKNRILAAVGAYFVYYIITQIISSVFLIVVSVFIPSSFFVKLSEFIELHPYVSIHTGIWGLSLLWSIFATICFLIVRTITTKKLNLE